MNRSFLCAALAAAALALAGCDEDKLVTSACTTDDMCQPGEVCDDGLCVPATRLACDAVEGGRAILQPTPHVVDFGAVGDAEATHKLVLRNIGNCTLTLFEADLDLGPASPFSCSGCEASALPLEIFPMREREVTLRFKAPQVGSFSDSLVLLSDDAEFPELKVPLRARFDGVPRLVATPEALDFGYLDVGNVRGHKVHVTNQGTGVAKAKVVAVKLDQDLALDAFSVSEVPEEPVELAPQSLDPRAVLTFTVSYHPRQTGAHAANLIVETEDPAFSLTVPVTGTSETPPVVQVAPDRIVFGDVQLGEPARKTLVISNKGGSPLTVSYEWDPGFSPDFSAQPALVPAIEPGKYFQLEVLVTASKAGDLAGQLHLKTNDPTRSDVVVPVSAKALADAGEQVVKVELTYENGSDSAVDDDLRNVDMALEHPWGFVCNKANPRPDWGDFGKPAWLALGAKEEPERIVLAEVKRDAEFRVGLQYMEDCSFLPTSILASVLGISVEALIAALSSGAIQIDGKDIGQAIEGACFNHSSTNAVITVFVNGAAIHQRPVTLGKKGDFVHALKVVRQNGQYSVQ